MVLYRAWKPLTMPIDKHGDMSASMSRTLLEEEEALQKSVVEARTRYPEIEIEGEFIAERAGQALVRRLEHGDHGRGGVSRPRRVGRAVLGSVSHHVLQHARCPVAVVR